ncbi:hypothetical protein [uncultured Roseobacter sp.]|uniref:hypothetical protein n=1 Tax=uncultured Roseobacter sp. TaxID=114847 RepID=UPI002615E8A1|nr:hypothetical protein [uncultured Roseobacter sp.]
MPRWLGNDPRYTKSRCFASFPFPNLTDDQRTHLRALAEELDAHRKRQQAAHPKLTLTQMYNVLEKLWSSDTIEGKDKYIYDQGLIGILRDLHDQIAAVRAALSEMGEATPEQIARRFLRARSSTVEPLSESVAA